MRELLKGEEPMKRRLCVLLAALALLGSMAVSAWAVPPDGAELAGAGTGSSGQAAEPEKSEEPEEPEEPKEPEEPEETPEPALEELRDTLFTILGGGEETQSVRDSVNRAVALGDPAGSVREWLETTIRKYQMERELEQLTGTLASLEEMDAQLQAIAQAVAELEPDELLLAVGEVCPQGAALLKDVELESREEFRGRIQNLLLYAGDAPSTRWFASVRLLLAIRDSGLLEEEGEAAAQSALLEALDGLTALCRSFSDREREGLERASEKIAARANLAGEYSPVRLVPVEGELRYENPLFIYRGAIMLSIPDAARFLEGRVEEDGDTLAILAPGAVLELVKGSSDGYLNDKLHKLAAPVLNFDGVCYLPLDAVLACCGMERMTVEGYELIYRPLPQENGPAA